MPTDIEELVGFITSPNPAIRLTALQNLVSFSATQPAIFKAENYRPVNNLKVLTRDNPKSAEHALTILINLSADQDVLERLATDDTFMSVVLLRTVHPEELNANLFSMLLANLTKWDGLQDLVERKQLPPEKLESDGHVLNQLVDVFVKGSDGSYNKHANYDYLAYAFANLSKHAPVRQYFVKNQDYDKVIPLTKLVVFTEHSSDIRRRGVASTIKNVAFDIPSHPTFFDEEAINVMPYVLLPLMGSEDYADDEADAMLPELQMLSEDKKRDVEPEIMQTHLETLLLLTTTREGRELMRKIQVYPIVRETHARVVHEGVQEACDRLVQVLMRDEVDEEKESTQEYGEGNAGQEANGSLVKS